MAPPSSQTPQQKYGLSCPFGGSFYVCLSSPVRFLGCCETDPCSNGGQCRLDELRPASYVDYPDPHQSCAAPYDEREWYTCDLATPRFMGCDPCDQGCPDWGLIPARLDDDSNTVASFLSSPRTPPVNIGLIVGVSVSVAVLVLLVLGATVWRKSIKKRYHRSNDGQSNKADTSSQAGSETPSTASDGTAHSCKTYGQLKVMNP
ncbi:hypothetical protein F4814DRAFT_451576 [Daldinia grandis]|nr:hypothetical protein F4814DRAFT_451576 [Daldinia grandis]